MTWTVIYQDTDKTVEQRQVGTSDGGAVYEQRTTWTNPDAPDYRAEPRYVTTGDL